jgi:serine/threonine-protein kinase
MVLPVAAPATTSRPMRHATERGTAAIASPLPWVAAFVISAAAAAWGWLGRPEVPAPPPVRFTLALPAEGRLATGAPQNLAVTPDGRRIVYAGSFAAGRQLYVRNIDELEVHPLDGTNSANAPAVSPDGRWVAWNYVGRLRKTPIDGGVSVDIAPVASFQGFSWISNDELVVSAAAKGGIAGLWRVSAAGGELRRFTEFDSASREGIQSDPVVLHEHGIVLYTSYRLGSLIGRLGAARLDGGLNRVLAVSVDRVLGFALGHVIYISEADALMAVPFDPRTLQTRGAPIALLQGLQSNSAALSPSGTIVYAQGASTSEVVTVDERGTSTPLLAERARYAHPRLSPDGKRLAIDITSGSTTDLWTFDVASGTPTRLTTSDNNDRPEWTADGTRLLYLSTRGGDDYSIWWQPADGSGPAEQLFRGPNAVREVSLTPDGRSLIYREDHPDSLRDIRMAPVGRKDSSTALVSSRFDELMPRLSPDGRWLAYQSNESGQYEIYVRPFPQGGGRITISNGGGTEPIWSRDARLFYRHGRDLVAVSYSANPAFAVTSRKVLFSGSYELHLFHPNYDVTADGKHFIMIEPGNEEVQVVVVVNWIEELRRRLGVTQ